MSRILQIKPQPHDEKRIYFWCPACNDLHWISVDRPDWSGWTWDKDEDKPTFYPSVRVWRDYVMAGKRIQDVCHFYIRRGQIEYLHDCSHRMRGKTVDMVPIPRDTIPL